jgi:outer membrane protein OmpA-like peptidoglycan-associated protein
MSGSESPSIDVGPDSLTAEQHSWASKFCGLDTRCGATRIVPRGEDTATSDDGAGIPTDDSAATSGDDSETPPPSNDGGEATPSDADTTPPIDDPGVTPPTNGDTTSSTDDATTPSTADDTTASTTDDATPSTGTTPPTDDGETSSPGGQVPADTSATPNATDTDLFFDRDSAELTASDKKTLEDYAKAYLAAPTPAQVHLDGHASVDGQQTYNQGLSAKRGQAAQDYLISLGLQKANIVAAGHGETDAFGKDDAGQNRRVTISPPMKGGGVTPPPAPGAAPVITHETEAKQPSNRARTKLGVGERVTLTVAPGPGTWTASKGKLSATGGTTVIFTAPGKPDKVDITVTVNGQEDKVQFDVIAPSDVHMDAHGTRHMANGRPNAGFHADIYLLPADVSFVNVEFLELDAGAAANGHWAPFNGVSHHPGTAWGTMTATVVASKGTKSNFMDNCLSGDTGTGEPFAGSLTFSIPWQYRVGSGSGTRFATVVQSVVTSADGTTTISKARASATFKLTDGETTYPGALY